MIGNKYALVYFLGLIIFAQAMRRSHGSLKSNHLIFLTLLSVFILWDKFKSSPLLNPSKFFCTIVFLVMGIAKFEVIYPISDSWAWVYRSLFSAILALSLIHYYSKDLKYLKHLIYLLIAILFFCVPIASPEPIVDVWVYYQKAIQAMGNLNNPYELIYPDIYHGAHHYNPKFIYWPTSLYLIAPIGLFADVRYALVLAMLGSAFLLYKKLGFELWDLLIFLLFPINIFVIEQSWIEPLMIPFLILHFVYLREGKGTKAALALGLLCSIKQFMLFPFLLSSIYLVRTEGFKKALIAPVVIVASFIPFLLASPEVFLKNTFLEFLHFPARSDSLSWVAHFIFHYNYELSTFVTSSIYVIAFIICGFYVWTKKSLGSLKWGYFLTLAATFLFGKQSFANYYFLLFVTYYLCLKRSSDKVPTS